MIHIAALKALLRSAKITIHPAQAAQIAGLKQDEASTGVLPKYVDYANVFLFDLAMELPENTSINKHAIEFEEDKQPLYGPIYSLGPVELETLKTYIKTHLKSGFIQPFQFSKGAPILFDKKSNGNLWLYVNYRGLNNLIIKNQYPLPVIGEALNWLGRAKQFT